MELRQLAVVVAVAEEGGFTAAAQRLRTVQSTVSTVVRALERDLGTPLFHRTTHRVVLTPAGEAFVPAARAALQAAERARAAVSPVGGRVRLGVCPGLLADLPGVLTRLRHAHPGLAVEVRQVLPEEVWSGLRESTVDVVLTPAPAPGEDMTAREVAATGEGATTREAATTCEAATVREAATTREIATNREVTTTDRLAATDELAATGRSATTAPTCLDPARAPETATADPAFAPVTTALRAEELVLATAPGGSRFALADPSALSLVDFPPGWAIRAAVDRAFPRRRVALEVDDAAVAAGLVRAGLAACVLPASVVARFGELAVRRFDRPPPWQLAAVHRAEVGAAVAAVLAQLG